MNLFRSALAAAVLSACGLACTNFHDKRRDRHDADSNDGSDGGTSDYRDLSDCILVATRVGNILPYRPSLAFSGSSFGLAWEADNHANGDVRDLLVSFRELDISGAPREPITRVNEALTGNYSSREHDAVHAAWNGRGWGITWLDSRNHRGNPDLMRDLYYTRIDPVGRKVGSDVLLNLMPEPALSDYGPCNNFNRGCIRLARNSSSYGLGWETLDGTLMYFSRYNDDGARIGPDTTLHARYRRPLNGVTVFNPFTIWTGSEFGVLVQGSFGAEAAPWWLMRVGPDGAPSGDPMMLETQGGYAFIEAAVWTGSEIGVLWTVGDYEPYHLRMVLITLRGTIPWPPTDIPNDTGRNPLYATDLLWTGSEFALLWPGTPETYTFARVTAYGAVRSTDSLNGSSNVWSGDGASLAWTGSEYAIAFEMERGICFDRFVLPP